MSQEGFVNAVRTALLSSSTYSYGSLMQSNAKYVPDEEIRGSVPPSPEQWVLQADAFQSKLLEQYQGIRVGETRMLIAATGIGKTTVLPLRLAMSSGRAGLVLMPDHLMVTPIVNYINQTVIPRNGYEVKVDALRSQYVVKPHSGPAVYYSAAEDFLPRFHSDKALIKRMNIDFIYLDEAHAKTPAYFMIRLLVGMNYFSDTKIFCGTATCVGTSLHLTSKPNQTTPQALKSSMFTIDTPDEVPPASPLHFTSIVSRTMIFLPTDKHIELWDKYYDSFDIPVITFCTFHTSSRLVYINTALKNKRPLVFLTHARLQTSFTFDVDKSVCCGFTQYLHVDFTEPSVELRIRNVTSEERKQRNGRADRHMSGSAVYNDVQLHPPLPELDDTTSLYIWMWARMFKIKIKNPDISRYDELMGDHSNEFISLMLCSRLHPALVMSYLSEEGHLYEGWDIMKYVFHTNRDVIVSTESNEKSVELWSDRSTGPQLWLDQPIDYKSRTRFPNEWQALPAAAWLSYLEGSTTFDLDFDNSSVVSALAPKKSVKSGKLPVKQITRESSVTFHRNPRPSSIMTAAQGDYPMHLKMPPTVPKIPDVYRTSNLQLPLAAEIGSEVPTSSNHRYKESVSTVEIPRNDVAVWLDDVDGKNNRRRRSSKVSSSSGSSHDRMDMKLRKVDALPYKMFKLYPMDQNLLKVFIDSESAGPDDRRRFRDLLNLRKNFSSLSVDAMSRSEKQSEYFLSVIRLHNVYVMESLQIRAAGYVKQSIIDKFIFGRDTGEKGGIELSITQSAKLLDGMKLEGYFVGVDSRTSHTSVSLGSPVSTSIENLKVTSQYLLFTGDPELLSTVHQMEKSVYAIFQGDVIRGSGWKIGKSMLTLAHVTDDVVLSSDFVLINIDRERDIVLYKTQFECDKHPKIRGPVDSEEAIMVGIDPSSGEFCTVGPCTITSNFGVWTASIVLSEGFSGFAVIAVADMCMVGMYKGFYMTLSDGTNYCHFAPASAYVDELARSYN